MKKIVDFIKALSKNDIVVRTVKTFVQAFFGVLLVVNVQDVKDVDTIKAILMSATSAGICACWNYIKIKIDEKLKKLG